MLTPGLAEAGWLTETVCPAMLTVPVRAIVSGLAEAAKDATPLPMPGDEGLGFVTLIHEALLLGSQVHPPAETFTEKLPPVAGTVTEAVDNWYVQPGCGWTTTMPTEVPWVSVTFSPPKREKLPVFGWTLALSVPLPVFSAGVVMLIQLLTFCTDHWQLGCVITGREKLPPAGSIVMLPESNVYTQLV